MIKKIYKQKRNGIFKKRGGLQVLASELFGVFGSWIHSSVYLIILQLNQQITFQGSSPK